MLQQNLYLKRVRFLDVYKDDNAQGENPQEQFDIDFALMTGELSQLLEEVLSSWKPGLWPAAETLLGNHWLGVIGLFVFALALFARQGIFGYLSGKKESGGGH